MSNKRLFQSFFGEFLASFVFGFAVYSAIINTKVPGFNISSVSVGLTVGLSAVAIIYTFCDHTISHFNPAITLASMITLKLDIINGLGYIICQLAGFLAAAGAVLCCFPGTNYTLLGYIRPNKVTDYVSNWNLFATEFLLTFILVFVAFEVGVNAVRNPEHSLYGDEIQIDRSKFAPLAIGFTLGFLAFLASTTSGGAFNPGIVFAPTVLHGVWTNFWIYIVAEFVGGLVGGLVQVFILFK